jgi:O-antigen/teichoic acid export membrane protein
MNSNNKRIAKNTVMLYFRMLLVMAVSFYIVRIVLKTLGVVDYGIYNVVGGVVTMFAFLSQTMASASQRFFAFELGRDNIDQLKKTFSTVVLIYGIVATFIFFLAETAGLWFLNEKMTIPDERMNAANWVYQFSILSFIATVLAIPYNAVIIAHENMKVFAFVSIFDTLLKLGTVYLLILFSFDKLKLYAVLTFMSACLISLIYRFICTHKYRETHFVFIFDRHLFKTILSYSGWNLFGALAGVCKNQGINILLNMFTGPAVNSATGIAHQVNGAVNQFASNFYQAVRPQITKQYAAGEQKLMMSLVFRSSRFSYYLLLILSMAVLPETPRVLKLWLETVPEYAVVFTRLTIILSLIESVSLPLMTAMQATGKIKWYQIITGGLLLINLPVSYCFLRYGHSPETVMYVAIAIAVIAQLSRILFVNKKLQMSVRCYAKDVLWILFKVTLLSCLIPAVLYIFLPENFIRFIIIVPVSVVSCISAVCLAGLTKNEYNAVIKYLKKRLLSSESRFTQI